MFLLKFIDQNLFHDFTDFQMFNVIEKKRNISTLTFESKIKCAIVEYDRLKQKATSDDVLWSPVGWVKIHRYYDYE